MKCLSQTRINWLCLLGCVCLWSCEILKWLKMIINIWILFPVGGGIAGFHACSWRAWPGQQEVSVGAVLVISPALLQIPLYRCQGPLSGGAGAKRAGGWKGQHDTHWTMTTEQSWIQRSWGKVQFSSGFVNHTSCILKPKERKNHPECYQSSNASICDGLGVCWCPRWGSKL